MPDGETYIRHEFGNILKSRTAIVIAIVFVAASVILSTGNNRERARDYVRNSLTPATRNVAPWTVVHVYLDNVRCGANACSDPSCSDALRELVPANERASDWECFVSNFSSVLRFPVAVIDTAVFMLGRGLAGILVFGLPFLVGVAGLLYLSLQTRQALILHPIGWLAIFVTVFVLGIAMRFFVLAALGVVNYTLSALIIAEGVYTLYEKFEVGARAARSFDDMLGRFPLNSLRGPQGG